MNDSTLRKLKMHELNRPGIQEFLSTTKFPLVVVLDNIRSGHNVGSIFRTADAFNVEQLYLCGISATPPHREILKSAIGATKSVAWSYLAETKNCIVNLKKEGYVIAGIEQTNSGVLLDDFRISTGKGKIAVVFGNEVEGLSDNVLPLLDVAVEIPQWGTKHSLNVAVCAGIVLWHLVCQLEK